MCYDYITFFSDDTTCTSRGYTNINFTTIFGYSSLCADIKSKAIKDDADLEDMYKTKANLLCQKVSKSLPNNSPNTLTDPFSDYPKCTSCKAGKILGAASWQIQANFDSLYATINSMIWPKAAAIPDPGTGPDPGPTPGTGKTIQDFATSLLNQKPAFNSLIKVLTARGLTAPQKELVNIFCDFFTLYTDYKTPGQITFKSAAFTCIFGACPLSTQVTTQPPSPSLYKPHLARLNATISKHDIFTKAVCTGASSTAWNFANPANWAAIASAIKPQSS